MKRQRKTKEIQNRKERSFKNVKKTIPNGSSSRE